MDSTQACKGIPLLFGLVIKSLKSQDTMSRMGKASDKEVALMKKFVMN